jgi:uncharacterized flavoprotein (TIGR03862 family)
MELTPKSLQVAIVGTGPAGLMAAARLAGRSGIAVDVYERRAGFGRKLLVAGSSGLNISHHLPLDAFASHYAGGSPGFWRGLLGEFGPAEWIAFIEKELGLETFKGTSNRYFVREMKASGLLAAWRKRLESGGVRMHGQHELTDFARASDGTFRLRFGDREARADRVVFAMGGGSWEDAPPGWPETFRAKGIAVAPFAPANVGYAVDWSAPFLAEAEGKPLKKIRFGNRRGEKDGELVVTRYGLEGTPVYFLGEPGPAWIDLKPDLTEAQVLARLESVRENLAPIRRAKQKLELCEAALALLFHGLPESDRRDLRTLVARVKRFPIALREPRPLAESISSTGGVAMEEVDDSLALRKFPGAYAAGEMLAWHAPTGGFLIQAAVSMGARIGDAIAREARP